MSLTYIGNNRLMTVVTGALYTAGSGTLTLQAGEGAYLPPTATFWIRQSSILSSTVINILKVTNVVGDVLTVVGGQDGTIDQNIPAGTTMCWILSASALTQLKADILASPWFSPVVSKSLAYPATSSDQIILVTGNTTITLPTAVGITGRWYIIKKMDSAATTTSIQTTGAQTIDGAAPPLNIIVQYQTVTLVSDGANWVTI